MAGVVQNVTIKLGARSEGSVKAVFGKMRGLASASADSIRGIGRAIFSLPTAITGVVGGVVVRQLTNAASAAEEVGSKFDAVFKELREPARAWANDFATAVNRSNVSVEKWLGTLQDTFVPLGFARDEAFSMSKAVTELAVDLASFNNLPTDEVLRALQSGIVGNVENFRQFGVIVNQSTLNQELLNSGIIGGVKAATEQQKAQARMQLLIKGTVDAQGDAIRTAGSWANQMRGLGSIFERFEITLGNFIIKNENARGIITQVNDLIKLLTQQFMTGGTAAVVMTDIIDQLSTSFTNTILSIQSWIEEGGVVDVLNRSKAFAEGFIPILGSLANGFVDAGSAMLPMLDTVIAFATEHPKLAISLLGLWAVGGPLMAGLSLAGSVVSLVASGFVATGTAAVAAGVTIDAMLIGLGVSLGLLSVAIPVIGTAFGAWTISTLLSEITGLDKFLQSTRFVKFISGLSKQEEIGGELDVKQARRLALRAQNARTNIVEDEPVGPVADPLRFALEDEKRREALAKAQSRFGPITQPVLAATKRLKTFDELSEGQQLKNILAGSPPVTTPRVGPSTVMGAAVAANVAAVSNVNVNIENRITAEITVGEEALARQVVDTIVPKIMQLTIELESRVNLAIADALRGGSEQQRGLAGV